MILDLHGFWSQHPDLIDRWHSLGAIPIYDGQTPNSGDHIPEPDPASYFSWWNNKYHGTVVAGGLAASREVSMESEITNRSSVGVAPDALLIGRTAHIFGGNGIYGALNFLHNHPDANVVVINSSYGMTYSMLDEAAFQEMIDLGVTITKSRGYSQGNPSTAPRYGVLEGFIVVGDYRPDFRLKFDKTIL